MVLMLTVVHQLLQLQQLSTEVRVSCCCPSSADEMYKTITNATTQLTGAQLALKITSLPGNFKLCAFYVQMEYVRSRRLLLVSKRLVYDMFLFVCHFLASKKLEVGKAAQLEAKGGVHHSTVTPMGISSRFRVM